jgi:hypothetical protein
VETFKSDDTYIHFTKSATAYARHRQGGKEELQRTKGMLITGNYRMYTVVMALVFRGRNPTNETLVTTTTQDCHPYNIFHPATAQQFHLRSIYIGQSHDFHHTTKIEN